MLQDPLIPILDRVREPPVENVSIPGTAIANEQMVCPGCSSPYLRRVRREGFMRKRVYAYFGYFPWECAICRKTFMLRVRGKRTRHHHSE